MPERSATPARHTTAVDVEGHMVYKPYLELEGGGSLVFFLLLFFVLVGRLSLAGS